MVPWDLAEINEVKLRLLAALEKKIAEFLFHKFQRRTRKTWNLVWLRLRRRWVSSSTYGCSFLAFVRSGNVNINDGRLYIGGWSTGDGQVAPAHGYGWSRTAKSSTNAYNLNFNTTGVNPSNNNNRWNGFPLRWGFGRLRCRSLIENTPRHSGVFSMVSRVGLEPTTPCLRGRCSNQLSYRPTTGSIISR